MKTTPYLNFNGDCREAFEFYAEVLGGKVEAMISHGDSPVAGEVVRSPRSKVRFETTWLLAEPEAESDF